MAVRSTVDWDLARDAMLSAGSVLKARMADRLAQAARAYCPVDTGQLQASIAIVAGGPATLVSGGLISAIDTGNTATAVHVVVAAPYALFVEYGHFAYGEHATWVPPNPFFRNAIHDTIGAFGEIAGVDLFAPFRGRNGWTEIQSDNAGTARTVSPLPGPVD